MLVSSAVAYFDLWPLTILAVTEVVFNFIGRDVSYFCISEQKRWLWHFSLQCQTFS